MKKLWFWGLLFVIALLSACSSEAESVDDKEGSSTKVQKIIVGTGTQFPNICFINDEGKLTGYDIEIVKAIDEKLPEYEFEFKTMEFSNLLLSLETKKIDLIAHQMEVNKEREEKFLFNKEPYNVFPLKVTIHQGNKDIKSINDLAGKKISVTPTSNSAVFIEEYNKKHNLGATINYGTNTTDIINQLKTNRIDAIISTPFAAEFYNEQADAEQEVVGETLLNSKVYFLLNKDETTLSNRVDEALRELKKEGVVSKLSEKWLGADYSVEF